jgi:hypothetical protein
VWVPAPGGGTRLRDVEASSAESVLELVPTMGGTLDILKHYLPRALEVVAIDGPAWLSVQEAIGRLGRGADLGSEPWTAWPASEQVAVRDYLHAVWLDWVERADEYDVTDLLCGIGLVDPDFDWYLDAWTSASARARSMAASSAFWDEPRPPAPANHRRLVEWVAASWS